MILHESYPLFFNLLLQPSRLQNLNHFTIKQGFIQLKQNKTADKKGKVLFIDASEQIRVGRAQNFLEPNHVQKIYNWYHNYQDVENYAKVASFEDLKENDFNLNIPLYVEKIIEDNLPSVEEAMANLKQAWQASLEAEEKFKAILKEFI